MRCDADVVRGGPNGPLSLTAARANFLACGASDPRFLGRVRAAVTLGTAQQARMPAFRPAMSRNTLLLKLVRARASRGLTPFRKASYH